MKEKLRQHIEKRVSLTDEEFALVLAHMTEKNFRKHQFLIQEGERVRYAYFVVSGLLKLTYTDESGKSHIVSFAMEDWWESDFNAFFNQTEATLSLDCLEDTAVFCFSLADFQRLCTGLPKFERFFVHLAIAGSVAAQQRILSLLTTNAQEWYEQLIKLYPTLVQRVSKAMLASYLGVSRETLSRLTS
ncbi:MAG: Crp/Fnr family transcriptional regulator [Bacteroidetes bacterium]|nr:Crp/Fnr family transcriptional regulator [Fibrella sp.]